MRIGTGLGSLIGSMVLASAVLLGQGCGDESVSGNDTGGDVPLFDGQGELPDVTGGDTNEGTDATTADSGTTAQDADTNPPDLLRDETPPVVVSTTPAAGADGVTLPLTITITFDEALFGNTVATQSVKLIDWLGDEIPGTPTLGPDGKTVTWKPTTNDQQLASAYTIRVVGNIITDLAGNRMNNTFESTFTTATYPAQEKYAELAAKYAPTIYAPVANGESPQYNVPTKLDGDGDWNLENNRTWINTGATQLLPAVYYSVTESRTHYFLHYALYFPRVNHTTPASGHSNAMYGLMVAVEKGNGENPERPLIAYTYWKEPSREEMFSFATTESNIAKDDDSPPSWGVVAEFDQATLFADDRIKIHVAANTHRICLWGWDDGAALPTCEFDGTIENGDKLVFQYLGNSPTPVVKGTSGWPSDMSEVDGEPAAFGYTLVPIFSSLWPRRFETGPGKVFDVTTFKYGPEANRPGANLELSAKFLGEQNGSAEAFGNPIWAWKWQAANGGGVGFGGTFLTEGVVKGMFAMDPAFYVWRRHKRAANPNGITDYVAATNTGFSLDYCFNGYLAIDTRSTDPACVVPPTP